jgi:hypothetical protein
VCVCYWLVCFGFLFFIYFFHSYCFYFIFLHQQNKFNSFHRATSNWKFFFLVNIFLVLPILMPHTFSTLSCPTNPICTYSSPLCFDVFFGLRSMTSFFLVEIDYNQLKNTISIFKDFISLHIFMNAICKLSTNNHINSWQFFCFDYTTDLNGHISRIVCIENIIFLHNCNLITLFC